MEVIEFVALLAVVTAVLVAWKLAARKWDGRRK